MNKEITKTSESHDSEDIRGDGRHPRDQPQGQEDEEVRIIVYHIIIDRYVYIYIYTHTYIHTYIHACMHTCIYIYIYIYIHSYTNTNTYTYTYTYTCTCTCTYIYIYSCKYIYIYNNYRSLEEDLAATEKVCRTCLFLLKNKLYHVRLHYS